MRRLVSIITLSGSLGWWYAAGRELHPKAGPISRSFTTTPRFTGCRPQRPTCSGIRRDTAGGPSDDPRPRTRRPYHEDAGRGQVNPAHAAPRGIAGLGMRMGLAFTVTPERR